MDCRNHLYTILNLVVGKSSLSLHLMKDEGQPFELNPRVVLLMRGGGYECVGC